MGRAKEWMLIQQERGYSETGGDICPACVSDYALADWIRANASATRCSFCGAEAEEPIAASLDEFIGVVLNGIFFDWNDPDNEGIAYEGGYIADLSQTRDVLGEYEISHDQAVVDAVADAVSIEVWVERGFYRGNDSQQLNWGWDSFKDFTKNQTRYFFLHRDEDGDDDGDLTPAELLAAFANVLKSQLTELIKVVTPATDLVRVRIGGEPHTSARAIGAPEREFATQSNRMSPAGIPMFYGAFDFETAYAETYDANLHAGGVISTGSFRAVRDLNVLDLAELPYIPSVFDNERREVIHFLRFLHSFANDISMPIAATGGWRR